MCYYLILEIRKMKNIPLKFLCIISLIFSFIVCCIGSHNKLSQTALKSTIPDINFFPINGLRFRLSELKNKKAVVIVIRDRDCASTEKLGKDLKNLENKYSKHGILFMYNYIGRRNKKENAEADKKKFDFQGPYLIDNKNIIVDMLSARKTGDVFILLPNRKILYKGPVKKRLNLSNLFLREKNEYVSNMLNDIIFKNQITSKILPATGCIIPKFLPKKTIFYEDIKYIIKKKCITCHHSLRDTIIDLSFYESWLGRYTMIKYLINKNLMPPWPVDPNTGPYQNDFSLTPYEKSILIQWLSTGLKRKKPSLGVLKTEMSTIIQNPDYTINLPEKTVIPKTGLLYKRYSIVTPFKNDKWIKEIQFITHPEIVHHIIFSIEPRDKKQHKNNKTFCVTNYKNSNYCLLYGEGWSLGRKKYRNLKEQNVAIKLPRNSHIHVEIHYESIGQKIHDNITEIRFSFYRKLPKYQLVKVAVKDTNIKVPPEHSSYSSHLIYKVKSPLILTGVKTHMHLRGLASSIFVISPKQTKKIFSTIYYFNFSRFYYFKSPIKLEKNSILKCINWFDNSSKNIINPNPRKEVLWGESIQNEMSVCGYTFIFPLSKNPIEFL